MIDNIESLEIHETRRVGILLAIVGGFLDVYTYLLRGGVFANAQTGNMVLLTLKLSNKAYLEAIYYFVPIVAFFIGVVVTELVKIHERWHEWVLIIELILLFFIGFYPTSWPSIFVNVIISFICAMQISSFRKLRGAAYATTVCTGNLRSAAEQLTLYCLHHKEESKNRCLNYVLIIASFCFGALSAAIVIPSFNTLSIWACCLLLAIVLILLIRQNRQKTNTLDSGY